MIRALTLNMRNSDRVVKVIIYTVYRVYEHYEELHLISVDG